MKMFAYHFRRLAPWERNGEVCRMAKFTDKGPIELCGRLAVIEFKGLRAARRGEERAECLDYCETHGNAVAELYGARIEAPDEVPPSLIPSEAQR
jgi:hypothetical protein